MECGDVLLIGDPEKTGGQMHLHVVITIPYEGLVVLVSITTRRDKSDTMTCLDVEDHPWIKHTSVVTYGYSKLLEVARLEQMLKIGTAYKKPKASLLLMSRMQKGMLETDRAPREVQAFFRRVHSPYPID